MCISTRAARGCFSLREPRDQMEADINVPFPLILRAKQGNLDISLYSLAPAFLLLLWCFPLRPSPLHSCSYKHTVQPQGPLCTHQQFWAVKRFSCHIGDSVARHKSFTTIAWGHDNDRETSGMGGKKKGGGLFTAGTLVLLATRPPQCPQFPSPFFCLLPAVSCQKISVLTLCGMKRC